MQRVRGQSEGEGATGARAERGRLSPPVNEHVHEPAISDHEQNTCIKTTCTEDNMHVREINAKQVSNHKNMLYAIQNELILFLIKNIFHMIE